MPIKLKLPRRVEMVCGASGSGKLLLVKERCFHYRRVIIIDHRDEYKLGKAFFDVKELARYVAARDYFIAVYKGPLSAFDRVFGIAYKKGQTCVVLEEGALYPMDEGTWFAECALRGRMPARVSIIDIIQRPQHASTDYRGQVTDVWAFRNTEEGARRWMRDYFGDRVDKLAAMPPGRALHWAWDREGIEEVNVENCVE